MLIELLSMSNYGNYNIKVAHIIGLEAAIYLNELLNINEKAVRKNKIDTNHFFTVDREYITTRTTLTSERQEELDETLLKIGILEHTGDNTLCINITALTSILMDPSEELIKNITKIAKAKTSTKRTKGQAICDNLKENIITTNEELRNAYSEWIDSVYAKDNWMSKKAVVVAQQVIDDFSNRNLDVALKVLEIATVNGFRDMTWAVNNYKRDYNISYKVIPPQPIQSNTPVTKARLSDEIF